MLRFGIAGILVGMGLLAGCQDLATPGSETSEQALGICDGQMPPILQWDGKELVPSRPTSVFVAFWASSGKWQGTSSVAEESDRQLIVAEADSEDGEVLQVDTEDPVDERFQKLAQYLMIEPMVRIPGDPPEPCYTNPYLCYPWIRSLVLHSGEAMELAREDFKACQ